MEANREGLTHRKTLHLSRPVAQGGEREPGTPGVGRGARQSRNAGAEAEGRPEAVAAAVYEAVETAAQGLHTQAVGNGKSGADMLQCPENRAVAARWRSGDPGRRVTAALARAMQALQEWAGGPQRAQASTALPGPTDPLPVRRTVVAATARSPSSWFSGLRNFRWRCSFSLEFGLCWWPCWFG